MIIESLTNPGQPIERNSIPQRIRNGEILVVRRCLSVMGIESEMNNLIKSILVETLGSDRAMDILSNGIESLHEYINSDELLDIAERAYSSIYIGCLRVGDLFAKRILGRSRGIYIERKPNIRFSVPYASSARVITPQSLTSFRKRHGEGKITPHGSHLDSWFNCPDNGINLWIAMGRVVPGNGIVLYPQVFRNPIPVDENERVCSGSLLGKPVAVDLNSGDAVLFSSEHLHATELNRTHLTRFAITFRITLGKPQFLGRHLHHYSFTGFRYRWIVRFSELPARMQWSFIREKFGKYSLVQYFNKFKHNPAAFKDKVKVQTECLITKQISENIISVQISNLSPGIVYALNQQACLVLYDNFEPKAFARRCPHQGADLAKANIQDGSIRCPWHNVTFDLKKGGIGCPGVSPIPEYSAYRNGNEIFVDFSEAILNRQDQF